MASMAAVKAAVQNHMANAVSSRLPAARPVEPQLVDLNQVTTEDLPLLMEVLEHQPRWNQHILIQRLQTMATHEDADAVANAVEHFVTSSQWKVRHAAWRVLGAIPERCWLRFLHCVEHWEPTIRRDAIAALRFWVVPAEHEQEVCEVIASSLEDSHAEVRMAAMDLMQDMNPGDDEARSTSFQLLLQRLEDSNVDIQVQALNLLCVLFQNGNMEREDATQMAHATIKLLEGLDPAEQPVQLRRVCVFSLGHLALLGCDIAKSYLYKLQQDPDSEIRLSCYEALGSSSKARGDRHVFIRQRYGGTTTPKTSKDLSEDQLQQLFSCMSRATFGTEGWRAQIGAAEQENMEPTEAAAQCFRHFAASVPATGRKSLIASLLPEASGGGAACGSVRADFCSAAEIKVAGRLSQLLSDPSQLPRPEVEKRKPRWQEMVTKHERRT